ncbi:hypothetical protein CCH79_00020316 [Gambusia affinis]|uniref:C3H1-type domain-containing protein n=1 Tax=Gambusia affinis TaxID=33528 RepID=A0A315USZ2_GAMAF|nr:hypothetical protein CCH79_00020316 [Gambusia affinis]
MKSNTQRSVATMTSRVRPRLCHMSAGVRRSGGGPLTQLTPGWSASSGSSHSPRRPAHALLLGLDPELYSATRSRTVTRLDNTNSGQLRLRGFTLTSGQRPPDREGAPGRPAELSVAPPLSHVTPACCSAAQKKSGSPSARGPGGTDTPEEQVGHDGSDMKADAGPVPAAEPWIRTSATQPNERTMTSDPQLDFFHKLGFSTAQVRAVQRKFGADTDKVLGELVRVRAGPRTAVSVVVPRGDPEAPGPELLVPVPDPSTRNQNRDQEDRDALRAVVIDGSNVAMSSNRADSGSRNVRVLAINILVLEARRIRVQHVQHQNQHGGLKTPGSYHGNKEVFSCLGIQLAVNFFLDRGHSDVTVFVPSWRKEQPRPDVPIADQHILRELEKKKILVFTPSRRVAGKRVVCNDDCFIVKHAFESDGVIVSNDLYRDLQGDKPEWRRFIQERLLIKPRLLRFPPHKRAAAISLTAFRPDRFMPPDDPLGRHGPDLENFLRKFPKTQKKAPCPYGETSLPAAAGSPPGSDSTDRKQKHSKCTYGTKCKFHHPERFKQNPGPVPDPNPSLVDDLARKLTLAHGSSSGRKLEPVRSGHRSGRKSQSRKEKAGQQPDHGPVRNQGSQDQLDSGLGSIDSQNPGSLPDPKYAAPYGTGPVPFCSCCSLSPIRMVPADLARYNPTRYPSCGPVPLSSHANSQPPDFQQTHQHRYWSDPFGRIPEAHGPAGAWETGPGPEPGLEPGPEQREVVRKKLLAIFSAQLVDSAMDRFPQVLDPQVLVAEILALQSQNRYLR